MQRSVNKEIIAILLAVVGFIVLFFIDLFLKYRFLQFNYVKNSLARLDLKNYDNLMIVAHPDDEILWGSVELLKKNYLVICVTCGSNKIRVKEFENVMKATNDKYIMLGYPDKILYKRSNWVFSYKYIKRDLKYIEDYKDWKMIVTHNKRGEYGHQHHKMVHKIVWSTANREKVYVFGRYCSKINISNGNCSFDYRLDDKTLNNKTKILYKYYKSQFHAVERFKHMLPYEHIEKAVR